MIWGLILGMKCGSGMSWPGSRGLRPVRPHSSRGKLGKCGLGQCDQCVLSAENGGREEAIKLGDDFKAEIKYSILLIPADCRLYNDMARHLSLFFAGSLVSRLSGRQVSASSLPVLRNLAKAAAWSEAA